jgi:hypothetical protein
MAVEVDWPKCSQGKKRSKGGGDQVRLPGRYQDKSTVLAENFFIFSP